MADLLPRSSTTVQKFAVITGSNLLEKLGNGSLNTDTASRKRRKIGVKYHSEDIEKCFFKVRRLSANPTLTDMERSLNEYQGTPRKKKFGELEDEIIRQQDAMRTEREEFLRIIQCNNHANERLRCNMQEEMDRLRTEKDEEIRRKNDEVSRKEAEKSTMHEIINRNHDELLVKDQEIKEKDELIRRKDKELRQLRLI